LKATAMALSISTHSGELGLRPSWPQHGSLDLIQQAGGDTAGGNLSLGSYVWAWPSHTTAHYNLKANLDCTLIMHDQFLPPKICLDVENSFVRYSCLEKSIVRLSKMDKLLRIGQGWKSELLVSNICSGHSQRGPCRM